MNPVRKDAGLNHTSHIRTLKINIVSPSRTDLSNGVNEEDVCLR